MLFKSKVGHPVVYKVDGAVIGEQLPTVTTETGAIDDLYLKIVFLEHLSRNYELRIKVLLLRTIIGDRDAAELTRRSLAPLLSLEHMLDREVANIRGRNSHLLRSATAPLPQGH